MCARVRACVRVCVGGARVRVCVCVLYCIVLDKDVLWRNTLNCIVCIVMYCVLIAVYCFVALLVLLGTGEGFVCVCAR